MKNAGKTIKDTTQQAATLATKQVKSSVGIREPRNIERRITEELHKIFDDTDSFYFSFDCDITNNLQRHTAKPEASQPEPDERFFWNMHMIQDLLKMNVSDVGVYYAIFLLISLEYAGQNLDTSGHSGICSSGAVCDWE